MKETITGVVEIKSQTLQRLEREVKDISDFRKDIKNFLQKSTTELLEFILGGVINLNGSDIHIEPLEAKAKLRTRIDGILQDVFFIEEKIYRALVSRIKLISGLKLNITKSPQDGRFSILIPQEVEVRTSTLPAERGESIVLRILNPKSLIELEELGLKEDLLSTFGREIKKPNGMIIVTGPTGSGKTTTLYAFLKKIQSPEIKIITIEDPIEYHLEGISQTQVNPEEDYDFTNGLQSIMRQDPDVILVGEIRDINTAKIALQAALTGHLVLATLHTNDAPSTIQRLIDLGADPTTVAAAINFVVAQRLLRKVCQKCAKFEKISQKEIEDFKKAFEVFPKTVKIPAITKNLEIPKAKGCKFCNFTGFRGRKGVFEAFLIDEKIQKLILKKAPVFELKNQAIQNGMVTMQQSALIDVISGITTLDEVERVVS